MTLNKIIITKLMTVNTYANLQQYKNYKNLDL